MERIADKVLAACLVVFLILYRAFPLWLAGVIIGRDLLIMMCGAILLRGRKVVVPSNLTGKYAFTAIVILLCSYVLRFEFGIISATYVTVALILASLVNYGRVFVYVRRGESPPVFEDRKPLRLLRILVTAAYSIVLIVMLYFELIA